MKEKRPLKPVDTTAVLKDDPLCKCKAAGRTRPRLFLLFHPCIILLQFRLHFPWVLQAVNWLDWSAFTGPQTRRSSTQKPPPREHGHALLGKQIDCVCDSLPLHLSLPPTNHILQPPPPSWPPHTHTHRTRISFWGGSLSVSVQGQVFHKAPLSVVRGTGGVSVSQVTISSTY